MTYSHRIELGLGLSLMMTSSHILNILMTTQKRTSEDDNQSDFNSPYCSVMFRLFSNTCRESIVRVAGATFTKTGVQSFLSLPFIAVSSASLTMSIPEKNTHRICDQHITNTVSMTKYNRSI